MTDDATTSRESDGDRVKRAALDFISNRPMATPRGRRLASAPPQGESVPVPAFADLVQYRQLLAQEAVSSMLGIENPFYKAHEGAAGATTVIGGRTFVNFASYDYLGLNQHPAVRAAAAEAVTRYGISASASRLVAGERPIHAELEANIADFYRVDAAVCMVSGYLTNMTTIACLVGAPDLILHDELIHNSALAGAQYSGAVRRSFRHNDLDDLERQLAALATRHRRVLVIVEGLYSMDGDIADLPQLIRLRARYGFWLMVDEAHALGVLGETGRGSAEHFGCDPRMVDIWMGTLSKTTASCGGYIAGSEELVALLKGYAGGFVYSVGLAPALAAAANTALAIIRQEPERTRRLKENGLFFLETALAAGLDVGTSAGFAVTPVVVGDSIRAVLLSQDLISAGVNVLPIIFPAVPEGQARLRFFITSDHSREQIAACIKVTASLLRSLVERNVGVGMLDPARIVQHLGLGDAARLAL